MKHEKNEIDLREGIASEWIVTNGLGGYSSSTITGINTRKYHGLLVAALTPPARRYLILSKLDESIQIGEKKHNLYANMCKNYISDGYKYLKKFEKEYIPIFTYEVDGVEIKKIICMEYGKNTVTILYRVKTKEQKSKLILSPILNFRDFHTMNTNHTFNIRQKVNHTKVTVILDNNISTPIYMYTSEGTYTEHNYDKFDNMYYIEEEKRGFFPEEDHIVSRKL